MTYAPRPLPTRPAPSARLLRLRLRRPYGARAAVVGLLLAVAALLATAAPASAHAELVTSNPADGSTVASAPAQLTLELTEAVVPGTTTVSLTDGSGRTTRLTNIQQKATSGQELGRIYRPGDPGAPTTVTIALPPLPPDVYRIRWTTLSAADMHNTSGVVVFGVQRKVDTGSSAADDGMPPLPEVLLRWLGLLGAAAAAGAVLLGRTRDVALGSVAGRRLARSAVLGSLVSVLAGPLLLVLQSAQSGVSFGRVLGASGYAWRWTVQEAAAVLLLLAALVLARTARPRGVPRPRAVALVLLTLYAVGTAAVGHGGSGALADPARFAADVVHLAASLLWVGLLVAAATVLTDRTSRAAWRPLLLAVGRPAGWSVAAVTVTGLVLAAAQVYSLDALLVSTYGRLLLGKLALAAVGGLVALVTIVTLRPALPLVPARVAAQVRRVGAVPARLGLRRLVAAEAVLLVAVVAAAAGVASSRPATGTEWVPVSEGVPLRSGQARDLVETLQVSPNRPGRNFVSANIYSQYLPPPGPITSVSVLLVGPRGVRVGVPLKQDVPVKSAQTLGDAQAPWVGVTDGIDRPGAWQASLVVHRDEVGTETSSYPWQVQDPQARLAAPLVSSSPWGAVLDVLAGVLAVAVLAGWVLVRRADRRGAVDGTGEPSPPVATAPTVPAAPPSPQPLPEDERTSGRQIERESEAAR